MSEADERNLIDVIMLARKLRHELRAAGLEPPEDEWSTRPSGDSMPTASLSLPPLYPAWRPSGECHEAPRTFFASGQKGS